jgi:large subunit ribosomal protein L11
VVSIAKSKRNSLGKDTKETLKEVLGTCVSMGVMVDGKNAKLAIKEVNEGKHDSLLKG